MTYQNQQDDTYNFSFNYNYFVPIITCAAAGLNIYHNYNLYTRTMKGGHGAELIPPPVSVLETIAPPMPVVDKNEEYLKLIVNLDRSNPYSNPYTKICIASIPLVLVYNSDDAIINLFPQLSSINTISNSIIAVLSNKLTSMFKDEAPNTIKDLKLNPSITEEVESFESEQELSFIESDSCKLEIQGETPSNCINLEEL